MKRAAVILLLLLCTGCRAPDVPQGPVLTAAPLPSESLSPEPLEKTVRRWAGPSMEANELGESCYLYQTECMNVIVSYPCVANQPEDSETNRLYRQEAMGWLTREALDEMICGYMDVDWRPGLCTAGLISVQFTRDYYIEFAAHPCREHWAVTLDPKSGSLFSLADLVDTGENFEDWLHGQNWTLLNHWTDGTEGEDEEEIKACQLSRYAAMGEPEEHVRDYYLTDEELVIIAWDLQYDTMLSVPLSSLNLKGDALWSV